MSECPLGPEECYKMHYLEQELDAVRASNKHLLNHQPNFILYYDGNNVHLDEVKDNVYTQRVSIYIGKTDTDTKVPIYKIDNVNITEMVLIPKSTIKQILKVLKTSGLEYNNLKRVLGECGWLYHTEGADIPGA